MATHTEKQNLLLASYQDNAAAFPFSRPVSSDLHCEITKKKIDEFKINS